VAPAERLAQAYAHLAEAEKRAANGSDVEQGLVAALARRYLDGLAEAEVELPVTAPEREHAWHLFVIRVADRARMIEALERRGVGYGVHYREPVHRMEAYRDLGLGPGSLPVSERACRSVLSLPLYPGLGSVEVDRVIDAVRGR